MRELRTLRSRPLIELPGNDGGDVDEIQRAPMSDQLREQARSMLGSEAAEAHTAVMPAGLSVPRFDADAQGG